MHPITLHLQNASPSHRTLSHQKPFSMSCPLLWSQMPFPQARDPPAYSPSTPRWGPLPTTAVARPPPLGRPHGADTLSLTLPMPRLLPPQQISTTFYPLGVNLNLSLSPRLRPRLRPSLNHPQLSPNPTMCCSHHVNLLDLNPSTLDRGTMHQSTRPEPIHL